MLMFSFFYLFSSSFVIYLFNTIVVNFDNFVNFERSVNFFYFFNFVNFRKLNIAVCYCVCSTVLYSMTRLMAS